MWVDYFGACSGKDGGVMDSVEEYGWECMACGEWIENDPAKPLSGCPQHKARVSWAPHRLGAVTDHPENWNYPTTGNR